MAELHVLRVFVAPDGNVGNPLGVFLDGPAIPEQQRQAVASDLGYSETVFVDDAARGVLRIFTPAVELPFAGHPVVGTAWLLEQRGAGGSLLRPPVGEVPAWVEDGMTWIRGRPDWMPGLEMLQLDPAGAVEALDGPQPGYADVYCWAWEDEPAGRVRSLFFVAGLGITEDPATGAAAVALGAQVRRPITIRQGQGSILHARPGPDGTGEAGGLVVLDEVREYALLGD